ncbi:MAG: amidohydrolase, partial [Candidatus Moranbacteria bacterium]|nr:amidohydrolase [Candidatus Moranbacteria bacterium]
MDKEIVKELYSLIKSREKDFTGLARQIWEKPELGFEEKFACARQLELLKELGFSTESPYAGVETAY